MKSRRIPVVGVMGGSRADARTMRNAEDLGRAIAGQGWVLLNGGRNQGVMAASAKGAKNAGGLVIGILPDNDASGAAEHLDIAIVTGMGDARNVINILSSDVVIACRGSVGTLSEITFALRHDKPLITLDFPLGEDFRAHFDSGRAKKAETVTQAIAHAQAAIEQMPE